MKYDNQLRYAVSIIKEYDGRFPLSVWLKDYFRTNKQMGSRDRKTIAHLVYGFYRLGHSPFSTIEERVMAGLALHPHSFSELYDYFAPQAPSMEPAAIFPWGQLLSEGVDADAFGRSFLQQPDLFLRIRPGKERQVLQKLQQAGISFEACYPSCLRLPNTTQIDTILEIDKEVVVQDLSSQKTGELMQGIAPASVWDCCAASGGKSIMASDLIKTKMELTVSDIRASIINNLKERLKRAEVKGYNYFIADLADPSYKLPGNKYDLIIADVPCSGSGTWARTPEQLFFFKEEKISYYSDLQKKITSAVIPALKPGGILLYITCSVFKKENEEVVEFLRGNYSLRTDKMKLLQGYHDKADSMFAARLINYDPPSGA